MMRKDDRNGQGEAKVAVRYDPQRGEASRQLACQLGLPLDEGDGAIAARFYLVLEADGMALHAGSGGAFRLDFARRRISGGADPLHRAIGTRARRVVDATAGWASDAVHLARLGYAVVAVEQNPVVAAMLSRAYKDWEDDPPANQRGEAAAKARLDIVHADSVAYLAAMKTAPEVVYLDPMYPPKVKSAAAKKPLAMLQELVGAEGDSAALFAQAMACATQRVVVKRPHRAPPIHPGKVGETSSKLVRFDIYAPSIPP